MPGSPTRARDGIVLYQAHATDRNLSSLTTVGYTSAPIPAPSLQVMPKTSTGKISKPQLRQLLG